MDIACPSRVRPTASKRRRRLGESSYTIFETEHEESEDLIALFTRSQKT